jgi:hypothetical protein
MGMLRRHLEQMKEEMPKEYERLMKGYSTEDELIREALGLSEQAMDHYSSQIVGNGAINE